MLISTIFAVDLEVLEYLINESQLLLGIKITNS